MPETSNLSFDEPTQDKLRIFVSSRLQECKDERTVARDAIIEINHDPVLFEHIGARPFKARNLYLSRLRDSTIMVAIFKRGYGYIDEAGGMKISGLEDEFIFAELNGIPTLVYVHEDDDEREEKLADLIARASRKVTLWFYREPSDLKERIRDDVTATITRMVLRPELTQGVLKESSAELLARTQLRQGDLLNRADLLSSLTSLSAANPIVQVYGAAGSGKTTISAQYAEMNKATYVRVSALAPRDVFEVCANKLQGDTGPSPTFATLEGARLALSAAWREQTNIVLVLDECDVAGDVIAALNLGGGFSETKRLVFTGREKSSEYPALEVPPLRTEEISALLRAADVPIDRAPRGDATALEVQTLIGTIEQERKPLGSTAREIMSYLALSPVPLMADDLVNLIGNPELSIEGLYEHISEIGRLVDDSPSGFRMMHAQTALNHAAEISKAPQKHSFYSSRLVRLFADGGDDRSAYRVAAQLGNGAEGAHAMPALRQSIQMGDMRLGMEIANQELAKAIDSERLATAFEMIIHLVYPMELMGDAKRASELLDEAERIAGNLDDAAKTRVLEARLSSRARRTLGEKDVQGLLDLQAQYLGLERDWDAARLAVELSALYIAAKHFEAAVDVLRPAIATFVEFGDEYGLDVSERNLAGSLAGLSGHAEEVDALAAKIEARSSEIIDPRRQRAWYANILTRRYRIAGRLDEAEAVAKEILEIASSLGDEALSAITHINLGNIYRDKEDASAALAAYDDAARVAQQCGRRDIEADGSRLRAGVLNDLPGSGASPAQRHELAKYFAESAIGLLKGSIYHEALARSYVELADAEAHLGNTEAAARAWFAAAKQFRLSPDPEPYANALERGAAAALEHDDELYLVELGAVLEVPLPEKPISLSEGFIRLIRPIIQRAPREALVRILGQHVHRVRSKLPSLVRQTLLQFLAEALEEAGGEPWRRLYGALLAPYLSQDNERSFIHRRLARTVAETTSGLSLRTAESGDVVWTVTLDIDQPITLNIAPLDDSAAAFVASQSLAFFLKAFETEIGEIIADAPTLEIMIQVARFDEMPEDVRALTVRHFDIERLLDEQSAAATRTNDYSGQTPIMVFLHPDFLSRVMAGEGVGGALQSLLGLTLVELVHFLLNGEVDHEQLRPKVVSMVRRTLS